MAPSGNADTLPPAQRTKATPPIVKNRRPSGNPDCRPTRATGTIPMPNNLHTRVAAAILEQLETADPASWTPPWHGADPMPRNAHTGRRYGGINILALWCAAQANGYTDARWLFKPEDSFRLNSTSHHRVRPDNRACRACRARRIFGAVNRSVDRPDCASACAGHAYSAQDQIVPQQKCKGEEIRLGKCMGTVCINPKKLFIISLLKRTLILLDIYLSCC